MINHDQAIFDAIAAATDHNDDGIFVDVQKFIDTFNNHRDRKLCTSLDVAQAPFHPDNSLPGCMMPDGGECCTAYADLHCDWHQQRRRIKELEAMHDEAIANAARWEQRFNDISQAPPDQFMDDYKRDTTNAMAARILELEAALREIENMAPATCEVTLAHQMADIASAALASPVPSTSHSRNQS